MIKDKQRDNKKEERDHANNFKRRSHEQKHNARAGRNSIW